jgi:hypothetical protein
MALVAVKNSSLETAGRDAPGAAAVAHQDRTHRRRPLPRFLAALKTAGYGGVCSLPSEYKGSHGFRDLNTGEGLQQTAVELRDLRTLL